MQIKREFAHQESFLLFVGEFSSVISEFGWLSLDTTHFAVEALSLPAMLLGVYRSSLSDRTDLDIN